MNPSGGLRRAILSTFSRHKYSQITILGAENTYRLNQSSRINLPRHVSLAAIECRGLLQIQNANHSCFVASKRLLYTSCEGNRSMNHVRPQSAKNEVPKDANADDSQHKLDSMSGQKQDQAQGQAQGQDADQDEKRDVGQNEKNKKSKLSGVAQVAKERRAQIAAANRKKRVLWLLGSSVFLGIGIYIFVDSFGEALMFYMTPTEMMEKPREETENKLCRLGGLVLEGSLVKNNKTLDADFVVTDLSTDIAVHYRGLLPDLFKEGKGVVVQGRMNHATGIFKAIEVLAKHDENYMPKEVAEVVSRNRAANALKNQNQTHEQSDSAAL